MRSSHTHRLHLCGVALAKPVELKAISAAIEMAGSSR